MLAMESFTEYSALVLATDSPLLQRFVVNGDSSALFPYEE